MAVCLENLEADLLAALGKTPSQLEGMSQSELAKLLSQNPAVPEKGIWGWLPKSDLVQAAKDVLDQPLLYGHLLKAFQAKVDTLAKRLANAKAAGQASKVAALTKQLDSAQLDLAAAKIKYFVEPPPPPLFGASDLVGLESKSLTELAGMIGKLDDMPGGPTLYSWMGKPQLISAINDLAQDGSKAARLTVTVAAHQAKVDTLEKRLAKAASSGDAKKAAKLQQQLTVAKADLNAVKVEAYKGNIAQAKVVGTPPPATTPPVVPATPTVSKDVYYFHNTKSDEVFVGFDTTAADKEQVKLLFPGKPVVKTQTSSGDYFKEQIDSGYQHPDGKYGVVKAAGSADPSDPYPGQIPYLTVDQEIKYLPADITPEELAYFKGFYDDDMIVVLDGSHPDVPDVYLKKDFEELATTEGFAFDAPGVQFLFKPASMTAKADPWDVIPEPQEFKYADVPAPPAEVPWIKSTTDDSAIFVGNDVSDVELLAVKLKFPGASVQKHPAKSVNSVDIVEALQDDPQSKGGFVVVGEDVQALATPASPSAVSPSFTPAAQKLWDASLSDDFKPYLGKWSPAFQEAGFDSAQDAGSVFYKWANTDFNSPFKGKGTKLFGTPEYEAEAKVFAQAVAKKDAFYLEKFEGYVGKQGAIYQVPDEVLNASPVQVAGATDLKSFKASADKLYDDWGDAPTSAAADEIAEKIKNLGLKDPLAFDTPAEAHGYVDSLTKVPGSAKTAGVPDPVVSTPDVPITFKYEGGALHHNYPELTDSQAQALADFAGVQVNDLFYNPSVVAKSQTAKVNLSLLNDHKPAGPAPASYPASAPVKPLPPSQVTDWEMPTLRKAPMNPLVSGGAHAKETMVDQYGNEWLAKPVSKGGWAAKGGAPDTAFLAKGEDAGHRMLSKAGIQVAPSHVMDMNGTTYHVQKIFTNIKRNGLSGIRGADLTPAQRKQLMEHQVGDWLIGNHDSHEGNFLILDDDTLVSIDKGQFMKFIGKDKLDTSYIPPGNVGTPYYHTFWKQYEAGEFDVDLNAIDEVLDRIEAIPDIEIDRMVRPYARGRASVSGLPSSMAKLSEDELVQAAIDRKNTIRAEFDKFRAARARAAGKKFTPRKGGSTTTAPKAVKTPRGTVAVQPTKVDAEFAAQVDAANVYGVPYFVSSPHLEYGRMLISTEVRGNKTFLVANGQTLRTGDQIVSASVSGSNPEIAKLQAMMPKLPDQPSASQFVGSVKFQEIVDGAYHQKIVAAAKTLAVHVNDGAYNQTTVQALKEAVEELKTYRIPTAKAGTSFYANLDPDYREKLVEAYEYYAKAGDDILDGIANHTKLTYQIDEPIYVDPAGQKKLNKAMAEWEKENANVLAQRADIERRIAEVDTSGGLRAAVRREGKARPAQLDESGRKVVSGEEERRKGNGFEYEAKLDDGTVVRYSPWSENSSINWQGHLHLEREWDGRPETISEMMSALDRAGIDSRPATATEMKKTYIDVLVGTARARKDRARSIPIKAYERAKATGATGEEFVKRWEDAFEDMAGVKLSPDYWVPRNGPVPSKAGTSGTTGYWPAQYRPIGDAPADIRKHLDGRVLYHGWSDSAGPIANAMDKFPGGLGKQERIRVGNLASVGASEGDDIASGGGDYFYTRLALPQDINLYGEGFLVSPRAGYRLGGIFHYTDQWGRLDRQSIGWATPTLSDVKSFRPNNETLIRKGASLWDDVEAIIVQSESARDAAIAALRRGGLPETIRGVPLVDRVVVGSQGAKRFVEKYPRSVYSWEGTE